MESYFYIQGIKNLRGHDLVFFDQLPIHKWNFLSLQKLTYKDYLTNKLYVLGHILSLVLSKDGCKLESVSTELNHFGGITSFFRDWAPGTLTGGV